MQYPWHNTSQGAGRRATAADFKRAASIIGCEEAVIRAVWRVEAAGRPFRPDGSLERRFEPHHFPKALWANIGFSVRSGELPWRASLRMSTDAMALRAYGANPTAMMTASSWGGPQIMGFNYSDAGYNSAKDMVTDMAMSEGQQLDAFVRLVTKWGLAPALRARDWTFFARRYNGPGQVERYAGLLTTAFGVESSDRHAAALESSVRKETGVPSKVVLRIGSEGASVKVLQRALGLEKVDGIFGVNTERAVISFQKSKGLTADGVVGNKTWTELEKMEIDVSGAGNQPVFTKIADRIAQIGLGSGSASGLTLGGVEWVLPIVLVAGAAWFIWQRVKR